jgi:hypothetical protein
LLEKTRSLARCDPGKRATNTVVVGVHLLRRPLSSALTFVRFSDECWLFVFLVLVIVILVFFILAIIIGRILGR